MNKLKILIMVALLPLLAACGGGTSSLIQQDPQQDNSAQLAQDAIDAQAIIDAQIVQDAIDAQAIIDAGLEEVDLTGGVVDTTTNYVSSAITIFRDYVDNALDSIMIGTVSQGNALRSLIDNEEDFLSALESAGLTGDFLEDMVVAGKYYRNIQNADDLYNMLNVPGVKSAHLAGWTGDNTTVTVYDSNFEYASDHGYNVETLVLAVAPATTINEVDYSSSYLSATDVAVDVITISVGSTISGYDDTNITTLNAASAVITIAAQHSNWVGDKTITLNNGTTISWTGRGLIGCSNTDTLTVSTCNTWAVGGLDDENVIYVGEVDSSDNIPDWSNEAGESHKDNFLVTASNPLYEDKGPIGNSLAAPRVAGAVALVAQKFPNTTAAERKIIILHTADDLGTPGVDAVYGHGRLNVGKALSPVGELH